MISKSLSTALVPYYSRFRLRGASATIALKKSRIIYMVFSVPTMTGLRQTSGYNLKTNDASTKDSTPVKTSFTHM